jgi:hypothetical protein
MRGHISEIVDHEMEKCTYKKILGVIDSVGNRKKEHKLRNHLTMTLLRREFQRTITM